MKDFQATPGHIRLQVAHRSIIQALGGWQANEEPTHF